ncbi:MAG: DUF1989 domain-containing protein [Thermomicrobiales bacterium]
MKAVTSHTIPYNTGKAVELRKGQLIRIEGRSTADVVFLNLHDIKERFDQARTKIANGTIFISKGDVLNSKSNRPMLTIVDDTAGRGRHDLQFGMCSAGGYELFRGELYDKYQIKERFGVERSEIPTHGCWENLVDALKGYGVQREDIPSPFNIFQETKIDSVSGKMTLVSRKEADLLRIDLRAEMDCIVGLSACPWLGRGNQLEVTVFQP